MIKALNKTKWSGLSFLSSFNLLPEVVLPSHIGFYSDIHVRIENKFLRLEM